jgi:hypothetical protein
LLLTDIHPFVIDPGYPTEFDIIENRRIEAFQDCCGVFIDKKIEENTDTYQMFFVFVILINKLINDVYSTFKVLKSKNQDICFFLSFFFFFSFFFNLSKKVFLYLLLVMKIRIQ